MARRLLFESHAGRRERRTPKSVPSRRRYPPRPQNRRTEQQSGLVPKAPLMWDMVGQKRDRFGTLEGANTVRDRRDIYPFRDMSSGLSVPLGLCPKGSNAVLCGITPQIFFETGSWVECGKGGGGVDEIDGAPPPAGPQVPWGWGPRFRWCRRPWRRHPMPPAVHASPDPRAIRASDRTESGTIRR